MRKNERGFTLLELLVWFVIVSVLSLLIGNILKLQVQAKLDTDISKFYNEIELVDDYIAKISEEESVNVSYTETELELVNSKYSFRLTETANGVFINYRELDSDVEQETKLNFVKSIKITKLNTLVLTGNKNGANYIYRVPVKTALQVFFNDEYSEKNWYKEVVNYVF